MQGDAAASPFRRLPEGIPHREGHQSAKSWGRGGKAPAGCEGNRTFLLKNGRPLIMHYGSSLSPSSTSAADPTTSKTMSWPPVNCRVTRMGWRCHCAGWQMGVGCSACGQGASCFWTTAEPDDLGNSWIELRHMQRRDPAGGALNEQPRPELPDPVRSGIARQRVVQTKCTAQAHPPNWSGRERRREGTACVAPSQASRCGDFGVAAAGAGRGWQTHAAAPEK